MGADRHEALQRSVEGLREIAPHLSAHSVLTRAQRTTGAVVAAVLLGCLVFKPLLTAQVLVGLATLFYLLVIVYRLVVWRAGLDGGRLVSVSPQDARALSERELPVYTVLVPAHQEPAVIGQLLHELDTLEYPRSQLDIKLLIESDDAETLAAARAANPGPHVEIVEVPVGHPRTKPKACNYGLLRARGELVTIYDVEDRPDPLQLRSAVVAFRRLGPAYVCLQARLGYFNPYQNRMTKWFTVEYAMWFRNLLPGLVATGSPLPLGGTSNHFRIEVLRSVGAWDPYNVTEDADLGIRLARSGHRLAVLDSVTLEEANSDVVNWVRQRSRWYKGYLQTWLVHMRHPVQLRRELGWRGFLGVNLFVAGTPLVALLNPVFWTLTAVWFLDHPPVVGALFPPVTYYLALLCFVVGNSFMIYINAVTVRQVGAPELLGAALTVPLYWVLMSIAAVKAALQLLLQPSYWEKTVHGLHLLPDVREETGRGG